MLISCYPIPVPVRGYSSLAGTFSSDVAQVSGEEGNSATFLQNRQHHLLVDAQGTVGQVERMLHVTINNYHGSVRGKDVSFFAPVNDPTIDASVSDIVDAVSGLDSYPRVFMATNGTDGTERIR